MSNNNQSPQEKKDWKEGLRKDPVWFNCTNVERLINWIEANVPGYQQGEMGSNEYYLRCAWDTTCQERGDLKNQVNALSAIKRGLETSLSDAHAKIKEFESQQQPVQGKSAEEVLIETIMKETPLTTIREKAIMDFLLIYEPSYKKKIILKAMEQYRNQSVVPGDIQAMGEEWRYFEIEDSSMEPTFYKGDIILASRVQKVSWGVLKPFYLYAIQTKDNLFIRRIFPKAVYEWILINDNEAVKEHIEINPHDVTDLWQFRRSITSKTDENAK